MKPQTYYQIALILIIILIGGYFGFNWVKSHYLEKGVQIGGIQVIQQQTQEQVIFVLINENNQTLVQKYKLEDICNG